MKSSSPHRLRGHRRPDGQCVFNIQSAEARRRAGADRGIRRGVQLAYGLKSLPTPELVYKTALRWQPYRSIASIYLWNAVKLKISVDALR